MTLLNADGKPMAGTPAVAPMIAIPTHGQWEPVFGMSLVNLATQTLLNGIPFAVKNKRGSILPNLREELLEDAIAAGATHCLFIDSDMYFPPDTLLRLLMANKEVIGCACCTKSLPAHVTAFTAPGIPFPLADNKIKGIQKVWRVGCGVLLIRLSDKIKNLRKPRFQMRWRPDAAIYQGEDWGFCDRLEDADIQLYIDVDLSREIGHIGSYTYNIGDLNAP